MRSTISNKKVKRPAATSNGKGSNERDERHRATISNKNESNEKAKQELEQRSERQKA